MEDVDLSYMAWKRGWKVLFCPESHVLHKHRSSSKKINQNYLARVIERNHLFFIWKNITNFSMLLEHLLFLPFAPLRASWTLGSIDTIKTFLMAFVRLPKALAQRNRNRMNSKVPDREIFMVANNTGIFRDRFLPLPMENKERKNLLIMTSYYPTLRNGGGVRMYHVIKELAKIHDVSLLAFWDDDTDQEFFEEMEKVCSQVVAIRRHPHFRKALFPIFPPAISIDFGDPRFRSALDDLLEQKDFDVLHCEFFQIALHVPDLKRTVKVLTHHEVQNAAVKTMLRVEKSLLKRMHLAMQWARWLNAEVSLARKFDRVVALTAEDAWEIYRFAPDIPMDIIPTGVDMEYFFPHKTEQEMNSLIYVGNFRHPPNVASALYLVQKVLPLVREEIPDVKLYIVGGNPPPAVQALSEPNRVIVTGWVDDMRPWIQRSNIYVFPIFTGVGLRNKILEAWAMGKPVVSTRLGCAGLSPVHCENVWLAENPAEFSLGICELLRNAGLRERLGANARCYVEQYHSWKTVAEKYTEVYASVMEQNRGEKKL
jgi:glycosyltransferase involved in cell wall biosynthesis